MNRILYLLRYLINNKKVKKFITIVLLILALMSFFEIKSHAAEEITSPYYYDGIEATKNDLDSLQNDFVLRYLFYIKYYGLENSQGLLNLMNRVCNGNNIIMFYYGDALGSAYQNTSPSAAQKQTLELIVMNPQYVTSNVNSYNWGLNGVQSVRGFLCDTTYYEYKFTGNNFSTTTLSANTARHYYLQEFVNYKSSALLTLMELYVSGNLNNANINSLIESIEDQTDTIENQGQQITNSINETNDFLNEDVSNSVDLNLDVEPIEVENENTQGISTLVTYFTNKLTNIITNLNDNVQTIEIPIPHSQERIYFQSNMISKYLKTENFSLIYTLLQGGYWLYFGGACIIKIKRIYNWFQDGNALEEGKFTSFMANLRKNNEFFDQFMM